jgi:hypothetical protein
MGRSYGRVGWVDKFFEINKNLIKIQAKVVLSGLWRRWCCNCQTTNGNMAFVT